MNRIVRLWFIALIAFLAAGSSSARGLDEAGGSGVGAETADSTLPMRIVQAGPSAFLVENALYMFPEAADRVAAMSGGDQGNGFFAADIDPRIDEKTILPRRPAAEEILAHRPDLVVMKNFLASRMGEPIERVGVETLYLDLESPEAWREDLSVLGEMFGNPSRAEELIGHLDERIEAVEGPLADLGDEERPSTLFLYWSVKDGTAAVNVPPLSWMQTRLVEMAGGTPVWRDADLGDRWTKTNIEQIAAWNPDVIVVAAYHTNADAAVDAILADPVWASLDAARNGRIYAFPADYYSWDQPDARWLLGLSWLAGVLHPDRFPDRDDEAEIRSFYRDFFFLGDAEYDELIAPRLRGMD
jgi:iron complex transport system substrate-binding protein